MHYSEWALWVDEREPSSGACTFLRSWWYTLYIQRPYHRVGNDGFLLNVKIWVDRWLEHFKQSLKPPVPLDMTQLLYPGQRQDRNSLYNRSDPSLIWLQDTPLDSGLPGEVCVSSDFDAWMANAVSQWEMSIKRDVGLPMALLGCVFKRLADRERRNCNSFACSRERVNLSGPE